MDLPEELRQSAYDKYGETEESKLAAVEALRERIRALPLEDQLDDQSSDNLIRFIRVRKYNLDKALKNTVNTAHFYREHPELAGGNGELLGDFGNFYQVLEPRDNQGRVVAIFRFANLVKAATPEFLRHHTIGKAQVWFLERLSRNPYVQVNGLILIACHGLSFFERMRFTQILNINEVKKVAHFLFNCVGIPLKSKFHSTSTLPHNCCQVG
jgi:hypothetical protein